MCESSESSVKLQHKLSDGPNIIATQADSSPQGINLWVSTFGYHEAKYIAHVKTSENKS